MKYLILPLLFLGLALQVGSQSPNSATQLRGKNITNPLQPTNHQALGWNQSQIRWEPLSVTTQDGAANYCVPASASGTTYTCSLTPALTSYGTGGLLIVFKPDLTNTGASTLNVNGLGAKTIQKVSSGSLVALVAGDLVAGGIYILRYNGTVFVIDPGSGGGSTVVLTSSDGTINISTYDIGTNAALVTENALANDMTGANNVSYNYLGQNITNDTGTGTATAKLAILTGAPSTVRTALTSTTRGLFGICVSGCTNSGTARIATIGNASCVFDNATVAGDYVMASTGTAGDCHDAGTTRPALGQKVGRVLSTNVGAGTYTVSLNIDGDAPPSGTATLGTGSISANTCASVVTVSAPGVVTTDTFNWIPNADISAVTGYGAAATDGLRIYPYPTADNVNFKVCNGSGASITPGAVILNWAVARR